MSPRARIAHEINLLEARLEREYRRCKRIGNIFVNNATAPISLTRVFSLNTRSIDFAWRRGTRIGKGSVGLVFRAINCSNGSIVCMKEIQLSSIASRSLPSTYPDKLRRIAEEIDMIMTIEHAHIVRYYGIERYKVTSTDSIEHTVAYGFFFSQLFL
jgi:serine/threonine protein kinase